MRPEANHLDGVLADAETYLQSVINAGGCRMEIAWHMMDDLKRIRRAVEGERIDAELKLKAAHEIAEDFRRTLTKALDAAAFAASHKKEDTTK